MSGLYLHIPFCKQACHYCNFHFSTSLGQKEKMVEALIAELQLRKGYLPDNKLGSIYFGGGTPSVLERDDFEQIFRAIDAMYEIKPDAEITLEANPDDLNIQKIEMLKDTPVNRLSIGIQSFFEEDLKWMNRAHNAQEAKACIEDSLKAGFEKITIDLIYGLPGSSRSQWKSNLQTFFDYQLPHLSAYALTIEPKTAFGQWIKTKKMPPLDEQNSADHFDILQELTAAHGMEQYEISNFAFPDQHAVHNTNYWKRFPYLGIGPSAHSFDGKSRAWNIAHNAKYIQAISDKQLPITAEELSIADQYNEYVMVACRTKWGISQSKIREFGSVISDHFSSCMKKYIDKFNLENEHYIVKNDFRFFSDGIASDLFLVE